MSDLPVYLFVYGTLRLGKDFPWHELLQPASLVGFGSLQGQLFDVGNYPGAVLSDSPENQVQGEVYRLEDSAATFARLDAYEACTPMDPEPHEYRRATVPVAMQGGGTLTASVYLYQFSTASLTPIVSGDYLAWRSAAGRPGSTR